MKEKKALEFALRCWPEDDDDESQPHNLKWDSVIARGILMISEDEDEQSIRKAVVSSLRNKFPILSANDFDFV